MSGTRWVGAGRQRLLLHLGAGAIAIGLVAGVLGVLLLPGDQSDPPPRPPALGQILTTGAGPSTTRSRVETSVSTSSTRSGRQPAGSSTTETTAAAVPPAQDPSTTTTGSAGEQTPPGVLPPTGDPASRLAQAGATAGYGVFGLEEEGWELTAVDLGVFDDQTYVDSVYRRGSDYLNLAQAPILTQPSLPNAVQLAVRGQPGQLLDMGGGILLVQWDEKGSRVRVTSDLAREDLLGLLADLQEAGADP